jgi:hypothetical protein
MAGPGRYGIAERKKWLDRQPRAHLGLEFRPQPFRQLGKAYRAMGRENDAREIAKLKERCRRRANLIKLWHGWRAKPSYPRPLNWLAWPFAILRRAVSRPVISAFYAAEWAIVGSGTAYGYGYFRIALFLFALWLACGVLYGGVADQGGFAPSNPAIYLNAELREKCGKDWTRCQGTPPELPSFSPLAYSLDNMLPVLELGQKRDWQPINRPDKPVKLGIPLLTWYDWDDPRHIIVPHYELVTWMPRDGAIGRVVRAQALLSGFALGLLGLMLSGLIRKD